MRQQATRKLSEEMDDSENKAENLPPASLSDESALSPLSPSAVLDDSTDANSLSEPTPPTITNVSTSKEASHMTASTLGTLLSETREEQALSVDEVAHRLYLEPRIIEALEKERYNELPPVIFVQGYLRSYARLLGLPVEKIVSSYYQATNQKPPQLSPNAKTEGQKRIPHIEDSPHRTRRWWNGVTLILLLALIGLVAWRYAGNLSLPDFSSAIPPHNNPSAIDPFELPAQPQPLESLTSQTPPLLPSVGNGQGEYTPPSESVEDLEAATPESPAANPATDNDSETSRLADDETADSQSMAAASETTADPVPTPESTPASPQSTALAVDFVADSWISITDDTGQRLAYGTARAGEQRRIEQATPPIKVVIGRPEAVSRMSFRGETVDLSPYRNGVARFTLE